LFDLKQSSVSPNLFAILSTIRSFPKISRKQLAEKVLTKQIGAQAVNETSPEYQQAKTALVSDLIWLAKAGHVIEFSDGGLDLPLPPKGSESSKDGAHETSDAEAETEEPVLEAQAQASEVVHQEQAPEPSEEPSNSSPAPEQSGITPSDAVESPEPSAPELEPEVETEIETAQQETEKDEEDAFQPAEAR
jgi:hypothetical protein